MKKDWTETKQDTPDIQEEAKLRGLPEYVVRANRAVPTSLVQDIVTDFYRRPVGDSGSMIPPPKEPQPVTKGNGWVDPAPMSPPRGPGWGERPEDKEAREARQRQAERIAEMQRRELQEIESRIGGGDSDNKFRPSGIPSTLRI